MTDRPPARPGNDGDASQLSGTYVWVMVLEAVILILLLIVGRIYS